MDISSIVDVQISLSQVATAQTNFGRGLILGTTADCPTLSLYSGMPSVSQDFETTDPEYLASQALFNQSPAPADVLIGKLLTLPQITKILITTDGSSTTLKLTVNSETEIEISLTADKAVDTAALLAAVNAASGSAVAATYVNSSDHSLGILLTGATAFTVTLSATGGSAASQTSIQAFSNDVTSTLNSIVLSGDLGKSWYSVALASPVKADIIEAAAWVESNKRTHFAATNEAHAKTADTDDTATALKAAGYTRSLYQWAGTPAEHADAALMGYALAYDPGTVALANKTISGVTPDSLTDGEVANLDSKNANYYVTIAKAGREFVGRTASGQWMDVIFGMDWLISDMTINIFNAIASQPKVPFTDQGLNMILNQMKLSGKRAEERGILVPGSFAVQMPAASSYTPAEKQSRIANGITFTGELAGAIQKTIIRGTIVP